MRQRLVEWIEDLRSVGGFDELAAAVEVLVRRLTSALAALAVPSGSPPLDGLRTLGDELAKLAAGAAPPRGAGRPFWK